MAEEPKLGPAPDERPRFFKTLNGWVAGLTGLVLAFAGLFTACEKLFPDTPTTTSTAANTTAPDTVAAIPKPDESDPSQYTGAGGVTMDWDSNAAVWVLTDGSTRYYYDNVTPPDDGQVLGYDKDNQAYLRWPLKGGLAQESKDNKATWNDYIALNPVAEPEN